MEALPPSDEKVSREFRLTWSSGIWLTLASALVVQFAVGLGMHLILWASFNWDVRILNQVLLHMAPCVLLLIGSVGCFIAVAYSKTYAPHVIVLVLVISLVAFVQQTRFGKPELTTTPIGSREYVYYKHYMTWWWYGPERMAEE